MTPPFPEFRVIFVYVHIECSNLIPSQLQLMTLSEKSLKFEESKKKSEEIVGFELFLRDIHSIEGGP